MSLVTTWFVLAFVPIVPMGSTRVLPASQAHLAGHKRSGQQCRSVKVPTAHAASLEGLGRHLRVVPAVGDRR